MLDVNEAIERLPDRHGAVLRWYLNHRNEERGWPGSLSDGTLLVSKAKGIYKPKWTSYAISVRQSLKGPYSDRDPYMRSDGTWSYLYFQENPDPSLRDSAYTNRGMVECMRDAVPVGVLRQITGRPSPTYRILGLALVVGWEDGYFLLEGFSPRGQGYVDNPPSQIDMLMAKYEDAASKEGSDSLGIDRVVASIVRRRGQPEFRRSLIVAYGARCAISGCDAVAALEACHIVPYCGPQTNMTSNGLLLRADLHSLFDLGLLAVNTSNMTVLIARSLERTTYSEFYGKAVSLPNYIPHKPSLSALDAHRIWTGLQ